MSQKTSHFIFIYKSWDFSATLFSDLFNKTKQNNRYTISHDLSLLVAKCQQCVGSCHKQLLRPIHTTHKNAASRHAVWYGMLQKSNQFWFTCCVTQSSCIDVCYVNGSLGWEIMAVVDVGNSSLHTWTLTRTFHDNDIVPQSYYALCYQYWLVLWSKITSTCNIL